MSTKVKAVIFIIFVCAFAYFCWYAYFVQIDNVHEHDLPLLHKQTDIKSRPEMPGGIEISNKDKAIYNQMLGKKKAENNVKVVEHQERPVSKDSLEDLINRQLGSKGRKTLLLDQGQLRVANKESSAIPEMIKKIAEEPRYQKPVEMKYSIRVAKLKNKRFLQKGVEVFYKKYPFLRPFKAEAVAKDSDYYMHFVNIPSQVEAAKLCRELRDDDRNCYIYKQ